MNKICEQCGASYSRPPSLAARSRFCGRACADAAQTTRERKEIECNGCGKAFSAAKDHGVWPKYCGRACFLSGCIRPVQKECKSCGKKFTANKTVTGKTADGRRIYCSEACRHHGLQKSTERPCAHCGKSFYPANVTQNADQKTCSDSCRFQYYRGEKSPGYKGGAYVNTTVGEVQVLHPRQGYTGKYMGAHRLAASQAIGRMVRRGEVVLRINGDKMDARPENLFLCESMSEAKRRTHGSLPWPDKSNLPAIAAAEQRAQKPSSKKSGATICPTAQNQGQTDP